MKLAHLRSIAIQNLLCVLCGVFFVGAQRAAPLLGKQVTAPEQAASKPKPDSQSRTYKVANPLNDLLDEAQRDINNKKFEDAISPLQKVIADQPEFAYAHFQLAYVYTALKKTGDARTEYERTIAIDPKMAEAYVNLGMLFLDTQQDAAAVAPLRKAVEVLPAQSRPRYLLAVALDRSGDQAGAAESFDAALKELDRLDAGKPPSLESLKLRADIQIAAKKWDDSIATLQQALALAPSDAQLHGGLGRIYLQKRDFPAAEKELRVALHLDGKNLAYFKDLSSTFFLAGNYPAALAAMDEIAKVEQPGAGVWFVRAICYDKLHQPKSALEAYQKFLDLDQDKNPDQVWQAKERSKTLQHMLERKR